MKTAPAKALKREVLITQEVYTEIESTLGRIPAEAGGILGTRDGSTISAYYFDASAHVGPSHYRPSLSNCERVINETWRRQAIHLCGFIHSHYRIFTASREDVAYFFKIYNHLIETNTLYGNDLYMIITSAGNSSQPFRLELYSAQQLSDSGFSKYNGYIKIIDQSDRL